MPADPELLITLACLLLGPFVFQLSRRRMELYGFLDGFVLVGVAGLILTGVLPQATRSAGLLTLALAAAGFVLPFALERRLALLPFSPKAFFRWLMILGLLLHQALDGVALSERLFHGEGGPLRLAVVLHQIPKGFFLWGMVGSTMGPRAGIAVIAALCASTTGGYFLADSLGEALASRPLWLFQAFVGGGLLHVIVHHVPGGMASTCHHHEGHDHEEGHQHGERSGRAPRGGRRVAAWGAVGALVSLLGLLALPHVEGHAGEAGGAPGPSYGAIFIELAVESAPSILLGLAAAGAFHAFLPRLIVTSLSRGGRVSQALGGIALGLPLPLCSCGVVPVYLSLIRKSVPPAAALAFLIATPEIGIDSFFLSWKWLGAEITLIRLGMAFLIALAVALTLSRTFEGLRGAAETSLEQALPPERPLPAGFLGKLREALRVGGLEMVDHIGAWLLVGIAVAALLQPHAAVETFRVLPRGLDVLVLSLLGLPLYVCASAATPVAAVLLAGGVSTGAVLAFLITGPSTNVTTFGILKRYHGVKGAVLFGVAVYGFSVSMGFLINWLFPVSMAATLVLERGHGALEWAATALLAALFIASLFRLGPRGFLATLGESFGGLPGAPRAPHPPEGGPAPPHPAQGGGEEALVAPARASGKLSRASGSPGR